MSHASDGCGFRCPGRLSASGANAFLRNAWTVWKIFPVPGGRPFFPPELVLQVKALACEIPHQHGLPLSRQTATMLLTTGKEIPSFKLPLVSTVYVDLWK
jgi:hypothetical protein